MEDAATAAQHHKRVSYHILQGKNHNSRHELQILLNAYHLCTSIKLKNWKSNLYKSETICILVSLFVPMVPMSTTSQIFNKNYFWIHIQINYFIFWTHQLFKIMIHFILHSIWNLDDLKYSSDFLFAFISWNSKKEYYFFSSINWHTTIILWVLINVPHFFLFWKTFSVHLTISFTELDPFWPSACSYYSPLKLFLFFLIVQIFLSLGFHLSFLWHIPTCILWVFLLEKYLGTGCLV